MAGQLVIRRWTKGPHDRLYVKTASGLEVGWRDLRTGREFLRQPGMWPQFNSAIDRWKAANPGWSTARRPAPPTSHALVDVDLADQRAGEGLSRKARQLRIRNPLLRGLARLLGVRTRDRAWRVGAAGEQKVGAKLDRLRRHGWRVLHSVELGEQRGDVDHLLIGPYGVFTVNTKHHPRARVKVGRSVVFVRRKPQPYVGKAHREATRVRGALTAMLGRPVHVTPLVVVHGHRRLSGWLRRQPDGVQFLPSWAVPHWFRLPGRAVLSPDEVEQLYAVARRSSTWAAA